MIKDNKEYVIKRCYTPMGNLVLSGKELKNRPDLDGRYVYEEGVDLSKVKFILFDYESYRPKNS